MPYEELSAITNLRSERVQSLPGLVSWQPLWFTLLVGALVERVLLFASGTRVVLQMRGPVEQALTGCVGERPAPSSPFLGFVLGGCCTSRLAALQHRPQASLL